MPKKTAKRSQSTEGASSGVTLNAFNILLESFLTDLTESWPNETAFSAALKGLRVLKTTAPRAPLEAFQKHMKADMRSAIRERDESYFLKNRTQIYGLAEVADFPKYWENSPSSVKDHIWGHISTLVAVGDGISQIPAGTLEKIERLATDSVNAMPEAQQREIEEKGLSFENPALQGMALNIIKELDIMPDAQAKNQTKQNNIV